MGSAIDDRNFMGRNEDDIKAVHIALDFDDNRMTCAPPAI